MNNVKVDIDRIEFVVTHSCTGKCKHCSAENVNAEAGSVNAEAAENAIRRISERYAPGSVMTFGGESLLYPDTVCMIHRTARERGIPDRQIITNGYFSNDEHQIEKTAAALCEAGVNDILISIDAFHQEFIPVDKVLFFAKELLDNDAPEVRAHPAWIINKDHDNPYNEETRRILKLFADIGIDAPTGNNVFPSGKAEKNFKEYYPLPDHIDLTMPCGTAPYTGRLDEITCVAINPNGDIYECSFFMGNINKNDILDILDGYDPYKFPAAAALIEGGVAKLTEYAEGFGIKTDMGGCYTACGVCRKIMTFLRQREIH
jgi:MoaA/NifB/PqqE/SkfB family radical SAM enzyme